MILRWCCFACLASADSLVVVVCNRIWMWFKHIPLRTYESDHVKDAWKSLLQSYGPRIDCFVCCYFVRTLYSFAHCSRRRPHLCKSWTMSVPLHDTVLLNVENIQKYTLAASHSLDVYFDFSQLGSQWVSECVCVRNWKLVFNHHYAVSTHNFKVDYTEISEFFSIGFMCIW